MFGGIDTQGLASNSPSLTWDFIKRLKDNTRMKVVLKGIEAAEDAELAVENGADGIIVSNHGGRATESGRGALESLPEVVQGAGGRIPVLMDSGVRRGTDVYKALALGASAVGIGRPYAWGLGAFGQAGAERVLDILNNELRLAMVGCGDALDSRNHSRHDHRLGGEVTCRLLALRRCTWRSSRAQPRTREPTPPTPSPDPNPSSASLSASHPAC